jgi:predicted dinucleotide-utilizing enzyme
LRAYGLRALEQGRDLLVTSVGAFTNEDFFKELIEFDSPVGNLRIEWYGFPSKRNPSTSADVPFTVIKAIRNLTATVSYG